MKITINKRIVLILLVLCAIVLLCLFLYLSKNNQTKPTEIEKSIPASVGIIDPDNLLINGMTQRRFNILRQGLTNYIIANGYNGYTESLKVNRVVLPDGDSDETIIDTTIASTNKRVIFTFKFPNDGDGDPVLKVPAENYSLSLSQPD